MDLFYSYNINIRTCTVSKKGCRHENTDDGRGRGEYTP